MRITSTHVYFWGGPFSNWFRHHALVTDALMDCVFDSSEQAFMFRKAMFFDDVRAAGLIANEPDPARAKQFGREVRGFDPKAWSCVALGIMTYVCYLKYSQNEDLKTALLETDDRVLVEASPTDVIWGVGLNEDDDLILDERNWRGQNLLGKALMTVRGMIK